MSLDTSKRHGQFVGVSHKHEFQHGDQQFTLLIYGALDVFGLIGSEYNGLVLINETTKKVMQREMFRESTGYFGPSANQRRRFRQMQDWSPEQWTEFLQLLEQKQSPEGWKAFTWGD